MNDLGMEMHTYEVYDLSGNTKEAAAAEEEKGDAEAPEEDEVRKMTEELMAFESYMKFYQIPYLDGQSAASAAQTNAPPETVELWSFDEVSGEA